MKSIRRFSLALLLIAVFALSFVLASCGETACEHEWGEWTVVGEAACTSGGERTRVCTKCGEDESEPISATGHTEGVICELCGEKAVALGALAPAYDLSEGFGITIENITVEGEGGDLAGIELAELVLYRDENNSTVGYGRGTVALDSTSYKTETERAFELIVKDGVVYTYTSGIDEVYNTLEVTSRGSFSYAALIEAVDEIQTAEMMLDYYLPLVEGWLVDSFLPAFGAPDIDLDLGAELGAVISEANAYSIVNKLFTLGESTDGKTLTLDLSVLTELHNTLSSKKVAELVDLCAGVGTFASIREALPLIKGLSVRMLKDMITVNLGVDLDALLDSLDELVCIIYGDEGVTLEMLLELDTDIGDILEDEDFLALSVKDALMYALELETEAELDAVIANLLTSLETKTFYSLAGLTDDDVAAIGAAIEGISDAVSYVISVDAEGNFAGASLTVTIPDDGIVSVDILTDKIEVSISSDEVDASLSVIPGLELRAPEGALAAIEEKLAEAPDAFDEDYCESMGWIPLYDGEDNLIGAIAGFRLGTVENGEVEVDLTVVYLEDVIGKTVTEGCGNLVDFEVIYLGAYYERVYECDLAEDELAEMTDGQIITYLFESGAYVDGSSEYVVMGYYGIVNTETGELIYGVDDGGHAWQEDEENSLPESDDMACGDIFYEAFVCLGCGETYIEYDYVGHDYEYDVDASVVGVSCGDYYSDVYACTVCGDSFVGGEGYLGHTYRYDEENSIVGINCGDYCADAYTCSGCGDTQYENESYRDHDYVYDADKSIYGEACGDYYADAYTCTGCGDTQYENEGYLPHSNTVVTYVNNGGTVVGTGTCEECGEPTGYVETYHVTATGCEYRMLNGTDDSISTSFHIEITDTQAGKYRVTFTYEGVNGCYSYVYNTTEGSLLLYDGDGGIENGFTREFESDGSRNVVESFCTYHDSDDTPVCYITIEYLGEAEA